MFDEAHRRRRIGIIEDGCREVAANFLSLAALAPEMAEASGRLIETLSAGRTVFFCGNGGSAADAQHLAAELTGRFVRERAPLSAVALTVDTSALTAIGNDYGFENVFARQLAGLARPGDALVALSTSGNSRNVLRAAEAAHGRGVTTIGLTGRDGGALAGLCHVPIRVPAASTARIQEMHIALGHFLCQILEDALFGPAEAGQ